MVLTLSARNTEHESRSYLVAPESPLNKVANVGFWRDGFHSPLPGPDLYGLIVAGRDDFAACWQDIDCIVGVVVPWLDFDARAGSPINYL